MSGASHREPPLIQTWTSAIQILPVYSEQFLLLLSLSRTRQPIRSIHPLPPSPRHHHLFRRFLWGLLIGSPTLCPASPQVILPSATEVIIGYLCVCVWDYWLLNSPKAAHIPRLLKNTSIDFPWTLDETKTPSFSPWGGSCVLPWSQPFPYWHSDHSGILLVSGCTQIFPRAGVFGHIWNASVLCTNLEVTALKSSSSKEPALSKCKLFLPLFTKE